MVFFDHLFYMNWKIGGRLLLCGVYYLIKLMWFKSCCAWCYARFLSCFES